MDLKRDIRAEKRAAERREIQRAQRDGDSLPDGRRPKRCYWLTGQAKHDRVLRTAVKSGQRREQNVLLAQAALCGEEVEFPPTAKLMSIDTA